MPSKLARLASIILYLAMMAGTSWAAEPARKAARGDKLKHSPAPAAVGTAIDLAAAKAAFQDGLRAFNLGLWEDAIAGFQKSYRLSGDAALLFNVAQAQRQAGHPKEAIIAYKAYLRENPQTPHRGLVEAKMRDLEAGRALAAPVPAEARPEGDGLAGVWENPFEPAAKTKVTPSEIPEPVKSEEPAAVGGCRSGFFWRRATVIEAVRPRACSGPGNPARASRAADADRERSGIRSSRETRSDTLVVVDRDRRVGGGRCGDRGDSLD